MSRFSMLIALAFLEIAVSGAAAEKAALYQSIDARADVCWQTALAIWNLAEPGYQETKSSALLAEMLTSAGFKLERGVCGMPTAFTATFGSGKPVIGILGEFDALPGLSQEATPQRKPRASGGYGHGCGHHLFGVASASAAIAVAEQIKDGNLSGTVRFYACPAEEGGAAKVFMVRDGQFKDCDAVLHWHPGSRNSAGDSTCLARVAVKFRFHGRSAHAAGAPDQARSALDAVELTNHAAQLLREHTPDFTRIHHVITAGGGAPNVVPDFAEVFYYVRHPEGKVVRELYERLVLCAKAGALATETKLEVEYLGGQLEILPNDALSRLTLANLRALNDLKFSEDEIHFANALAETLQEPAPLTSISEVVDRQGSTSKGSTDVGDVSWAAPTTGFGTVCWVPGTPGHSWQATAAGATTIGRKGMLLAAKVLSATAWDLYTKPELLAAAKAEHERRLAATPYESLLQPGQKPPLDYRNPPQQAIKASAAE
jgi:aminobenzoyl-glutamate utilization protein B